MAKTASQRRFAKRVTDLSVICASEPERFVRVWDTYVRGWLGEIRNRARAQRIGDSDERHLLVFDVLTLARRMAQAAGVSANAQVSSYVNKSLVVLKHECAKTVASLTDSRLYSFNEDGTTKIRNANVKDRTRG